MDIKRELNPLLELEGLPRFSEIRPEHVEPALDTVLAENREALARLEQEADAATWDNFVVPMEDLDERLSRMWSPVSHLNAVRDSDALRQAYEASLPKLSEYYTEVGQNEAFYRAFKHVAEGSEWQRLDRAQRKIVTNALRDFRLSGVALDPVHKRRFKEIMQQLSQLGNRFERHVLDANHAWALVVTDREQLAGLPDTAVAMAAQSAQRDGTEGWKFTLDFPSYMPFMMHADHRELRKNMYEAYVTRASDRGPNAGRFDNGSILTEVLRLRREAAALLGFENYAWLSLETKMAASPQQVLEFLHDLAARAKPAAQRELDELRRFARDEHGVDRLEPWDLAYYSEKMRRALYDYSDEDVRPYLPAPKVLAGMFEVVERLYGLRIEQTDGVDVWDPDVRFYEIRDAGGEVRGRFYVDLYVRPHKRGGAWMHDCISRRRRDGDVQVPVAYLVCNFSPPVGDRPALLTHDEMTTLFHEFGHGLHHMLTRVDYYGVSGINGVPWDAVELPSQFMENWCWEREALDMLGGHYQTGEKLPEPLLDKMKAARNFQSGMQMVRQLEFALFDMLLHCDFDPDGDKTVQQVLDEVRREVAVVIPPSYNRFQNSFTHIFAGGYAAGYYSYKWAEVLSADAFSRFEEEGIFNRETGRAFLENILERGGADEPMDLFVAFRGRPPTIDALLRHNGLDA